MILGGTQGILPPLDPPHHLRRNEWLTYREGVVLDKSVEDGQGSYVNVGLAKVQNPPLLKNADIMLNFNSSLLVAKLCFGNLLPWPVQVPRPLVFLRFWNLSSWDDFCNETVGLFILITFEGRT